MKLISHVLLVIALSLMSCSSAPVFDSNNHSLNWNIGDVTATGTIIYKRPSPTNDWQTVAIVPVPLSQYTLSPVPPVGTQFCATHTNSNDGTESFASNIVTNNMKSSGINLIIK